MKKIFRSSVLIASLFIVVNKSHAQLASEKQAIPAKEELNAVPSVSLVAVPATASSLPLAKPVTTLKVADSLKGKAAARMLANQGAEPAVKVTATPAAKVPAVPTQEVALPKHQ